MEKILIGDKPSISYVLNATDRLKDAQEIEILARGKNISKAVDVAEMISNDQMPRFKEKITEIGTDTYKEGDKDRKVSSIRIVLK